MKDFLNQVEDNIFFNDKLLHHNTLSLLDNSKIFFNESFDFMNSLDSDIENSYRDIDTPNFIPNFKIKNEIPEKTNSTEKKNHSNFYY